MDIFGGIKKVFGIGSPQAEAVTRTQTFNSTNEPDPQVAPPAPVDNVEYAYKWLTGEGLLNYTDGNIKPMSPEGASGLLGNWMTETGDQTLTNLDIVEDGGKGKGRGISQYTGARRVAYDNWRQGVLDEKRDPGDMGEQLKFFVNEYLGKYDPAPGKSLIGYTNALSELDGMTAAEAARHLSNDFFRPSIPHIDRRVQNALDGYNRFN